MFISPEMKFLKRLREKLMQMQIVLADALEKGKYT